MRLGAFGLGNMGSAFVRGAMEAGVVASSNVTGYDPVRSSGADLAIQRAATTHECAMRSNVWLLAVKPHGIVPLLDEIRVDAGEDLPIVVSLAAGVPLATLVAHAPMGSLVIRTMSNLAASVGAGATAWIASRPMTDRERATVESLVGSVGASIELSDEEHLHAFTGAVGSGIAWLFLAAEAIADGAVAEGLPRDLARQAAAAAVLGAGRMLDGGAVLPGDLKDRVCSPGGTTIEGIVALEKAGVRAGFIDAVRQAAARSRALAKR